MPLRQLEQRFGPGRAFQMHMKFDLRHRFDEVG